MNVLRMTDLDLRGRRLLIREDLNVPIKDGKVTSDARIRASLPTIERAIGACARVMIMSHLGRPTEGRPEERFSLRPVAEHLAVLLGRPVTLVDDYLERAPELAEGEVVLLENVRFNRGEADNDEALSKAYATLCDIYVMDAFGTAHRAQASTHGAGRFAPLACAGPLLMAELEALGRAMDKPARPMIAVVGGAKVSTKLTVLDSLCGVVDRLIAGGGIANTFIAAAGHGVGRSLYEPDLVGEARRLIKAMRARGGEIPIPEDVVVGPEISEQAPATVKAVDAVAADDLILDIGPATAARYAELLRSAATVVWNGPLGVFEIDRFGAGTRTVGEAIADSGAFSLAGGGDTIAAIDKYGLADRISYISTGGGAFLEFLEGRRLPAVAMLEDKAGAVAGRGDG